MVGGGVRGERKAGIGGSEREEGAEGRVWEGLRGEGGKRKRELWHCLSLVRCDGSLWQPSWASEIL